MSRRCLFVAGFFLALVCVVHGARAEWQPVATWPGVSYGHEARVDPPMQLHWVVLDLRRPGIEVRVCRGGDDPDGDGPFQTTLMRTSAIAQREGFDIAVNGDFFTVGRTVAQPSAATYTAGAAASVEGPAMTDGQLWAASAAVRPVLVITAERRALITTSDRIPDSARQVIAGNTKLLEDGKKTYPESRQAHPRTVAGIDRSGERLTLLVVDGRHAGSVGMTYTQLAEEMLRLGCDSALNLDGGGSTTLVMRQPPGGELRILNRPSDGRERAVANVLGVLVDPLLPSIVSAGQWGSRPLPIPDSRRQTPSRITLHHAGVLWKADDDPLARIRGLQSWGQREKKWPDLPYHFLIAPDGRVFEGRDVRYEPESNTRYELAGNIGICLWGDFERQRVGARQLQATVKLVAWLCREHSIDPATLRGHKDLADTDCPGKDFYRYLVDGDLNRWVGTVMKGQAPAITLKAALSDGPAGMIGDPP